jgi:hypothetical protein
MKKFVSSLISFAVIISATAHATTSFILPNPLFEAMKRPVNDIYAVIWIGNFDDGYSASDVRPEFVLINGGLVPDAIEVAPHDFFGGDALKITINMSAFLPPYGTLWNTEIQNYTVEGRFYDDIPFTVNQTFTTIGHISGDANSDGQVTVEDMTFIINAMFRGGPLPQFPLTADVDGNCVGPNIGDLTYLINSIYRGGPDPTHCSQ